MQNWIKSFRVVGWVVISLMMIAMLYAGVMVLDGPNATYSVQAFSGEGPQGAALRYATALLMREPAEHRLLLPAQIKKRC